MRLNRMPSARELRRLSAKRSHTPSKPARSKAAPAMLIKMMCVLDPLERILDDIERTGMIDTANGQPVFQLLAEAGAVAYPAPPALEGMADFFEMFCHRRGARMDLVGIRQLAKKLEYGMTLSQANIDAARADMQKMRGLVPLLNQEEADSLILQVQIKSYLSAHEGVA